MHRPLQDFTKIASRLIVDYGADAETEAAERAELLQAIGRHKDAQTWLAIMRHVATLQQQPPTAKPARGHNAEAL